ncbi:MAG: nitrous oxide-stimulated promoter family protein [bacterium]
MIILNEEKIIEFMIKLYCKKNCTGEKTELSLCSDCDSLLVYAKKRIELCRHKETKNFCANCETQCYSPKMKEQIRKVMKFSGPRMLIYNPRLAIYHVICTIKYKSKKRKGSNS